MRACSNYSVCLRLEIVPRLKIGTIGMKPAKGAGNGVIISTAPPFLAIMPEVRLDSLS